ncbi:hypothetical protein FQZ97_1146570 [compost metagenome]
MCSFAGFVAVGVLTVVGDLHRVAVVIFGVLVQPGLAVVAVEPPSCLVISLGRDEPLAGELIRPGRAPAELHLAELEVQFITAFPPRRGAARGEHNDVLALAAFAHVVGLQCFFGHGKPSLACIAKLSR